ncbi:hypothetical protein VTN77DRAFT_4860 [Rasamsonia byssochlamydoides]|uniref:uncharacterized protein n=1 Tax=Rasamsonia byssochlamydoides TaxID=89139 RepID=UPI003742DECF
MNLGSKILERAAVRIEILETCHDDDDSSSTQAFFARYYLMRALLSSRQEKPHLAEHMLSKIPEVVIENDPDMAEEFADLCHNIAKWALQSDRTKLAMEWLQRLSKMIKILHQHHRSDLDCRRIHVAVLQTLVRAKPGKTTEAFQSQAMETLKIIQKHYPREFPVLVLQLEVMLKQGRPNYKHFYETLGTLIQIMEPTEPNFRRSLYYIQKLFNWSPQLSLEALRQLFLERDTVYGNEPWLERSFVAVIRLVAAASVATQDCLNFLNDTAIRLSDVSRLSLSAMAADASLIILWKKIEFEFLQRNFSTAQEWCRFGQHAIFQQATLANRSKILRKMALCALETSDSFLAKYLFYQFPEAGRSDPSTTYLMYKLSLKDEDIDFGATCLDSLSKLGGEEGMAYLLACISEAQRSGNRKQAIVALDQLLKERDRLPREEMQINLPALFRYKLAVLLTGSHNFTNLFFPSCTARLIVLEMRENPVDDSTLRERVCTIFELCKPSMTLISDEKLYTLDEGPLS